MLKEIYELKLNDRIERMTNKFAERLIRIEIGTKDEVTESTMTQNLEP